jgi:hypothetical protein
MSEMSFLPSQCVRRSRVRLCSPRKNPLKLLPIPHCMLQADSSAQMAFAKFFWNIRESRGGERLSERSSHPAGSRRVPRRPLLCH